LMIVLIAVKASAADFTITAVGAFGEPLTTCRVESFQSLHPKHEYKQRFHNLSASNLPDREYNAVITCLEVRAEKQVTVSPSEEFAVISQSTRIMRSDHHPHQLAIRMTAHPPNRETWWVTLRSVYSESNYTRKFDTSTGEAHIPDPDPGSYLVSVLSTSGYTCVREIDLMEFSDHWTFDSAVCAFQTDDFAHLVSEEDKRSLKTTSWYRDMRKREEEFHHTIAKAINAQHPGSNK